MTSRHDGAAAPQSRRKWAQTFAPVAIAITAGVLGSYVLRDADQALVRSDPIETYDPVEAGELAPEGFRQLLVRDQIAPVYEPPFTSASQVGWPSGMLVIGVTGISESKAYPVTHLNEREVVIDYIEDEPILVSW